MSENANSLAGQAAHFSEALDRFDTDRSSQSWSTDAELADEADGGPETGTELTFEADDVLETDAEQTDAEDSATAKPRTRRSQNKRTNRSRSMAWMSPDFG